MLDANIALGLLDILREISANPNLSADKATLLCNIPEWDSMSTVEAVLLIESRFAIDIEFNENYATATVGELSDLVRTAVAKLPVCYASSGFPF